MAKAHHRYHTPCDAQGKPISPDCSRAMRRYPQRQRGKRGYNASSKARATTMTDNPLFSHFNYWIVAIIMMIGLYTIITHTNLIKKLIGLSIFQAAIFILFITLGKVAEGTAPILIPAAGTQQAVYASPLPHVLILTAIVVGIATTALGLALVVRIHNAYGSSEEDTVLARMAQQE